MIERDLSQPDRIVGELLQPGGVAALTQLGLGGVLEGIDAVGVEGYCVVSGERRVGVPYPKLEAMAGMKGEKKASDGVLRQKNICEKREENGYTNGVSNGNGYENGRANGNGLANLRKRLTSAGSGSQRKLLACPAPSYDYANGHANANGHGNGDGNGETNGSPWHVESLSGKKEGRSFHHGRLISALRQRCLHDSPNLTVLEGTVRDLIYCEHTDRVIGVSAAFKVNPSSTSMSTDATPEPTTVVRKIYAPITIIADGCFSKFRTTRGSRLPVAKTRSHFVGLILKDVDLPMQKHGTVCLTPAGPVLLYQIADEARETRMLVDVKGKLPSVADGSLKVGRESHPTGTHSEWFNQDHIASKYVPHLPANLQHPVLDALSTQRLRTMPNSFLPPSMQGRTSASLSGVIMVGDAWNMRHPLTGGGMTVAFSDAVLLTEYLRPSVRLPAGRDGLEDWEKVSEGLREWFWRRKGLAGVVNVLSMALYDLFGGADGESIAFCFL